MKTLLHFGWALMAIGMAACTSNTDDDEIVDAGDTDTGVVDSGEMDTGVVDTGVTAKCQPPGPELEVGAAPNRRGDMAYAFDTNCERIVMFHGDKAEPQMCGFAASEFLTDGWVFDPATRKWAEIPMPSGPAPIQRARASATWDPNSNRLILFGGRYRAGTSGPYTFLNDIWAYDPSTNTWEELGNQSTPGAPSGRMNTTMVADPARNRVLVHDGGTTDLNTFIIDPGVWAFNLETRTWEQLAINGPTPPDRLFHVAALDKTRDRLFIYGGGGTNAFTGPFFGDTWYLDLNTLTWTEVTDPSFPEGRIKGTMEYDEARDRMILFAGHDNSSLGNNNDVWTLDLNTQIWDRVPGGDVFNRPAFDVCDFPADFATIDPAFPERRESHLFSIFGDKALMYSGRTDCGLSNDTWFFDMINMTWERLNDSFTGMTCFRSGRTDCNEPDARKCG